MRNKIIMGLVISTILVSHPATAYACGIGAVDMANSPYNRMSGPAPTSPPVTHPATGNKFWTLKFTSWPQYACPLATALGGFRTIPMPINGPGQPMNGCMTGISLPAGAVLRGLTFRPSGSSVLPSTDPAQWSAAYLPSTGMAPFKPAGKVELAQVRSLQGEDAQAFESLGPFLINDSFFDIFILVETPPDMTEEDLMTEGTIGLYGVHFAGSHQAQAHPERLEDECTLGEPQIHGFTPFDPES